MTIAQYAYRLASERPEFTPGGKLAKVPSLLNELREAVTHSTSGGSGSEGMPLPFNTGALELLRSIERDAGEHHAERYGERFFGTLEQLLMKIAEDQGHDVDWLIFFERLFMDWCDLIESMVRPTKVRCLDGVECPSCGRKIHGDGRETCLAIRCYQPGGGRDLLPVNEWTATCRACGAEWSGDGMKWLVASLAA